MANNNEGGSAGAVLVAVAFLVVLWLLKAAVVGLLGG